MRHPGERTARHERGLLRRGRRIRPQTKAAPASSAMSSGFVLLRTARDLPSRIVSRPIEVCKAQRRAVNSVQACAHHRIQTKRSARCRRAESKLPQLCVRARAAMSRWQIPAGQVLLRGIQARSSAPRKNLSQDSRCAASLRAPISACHSPHVGRPAVARVARTTCARSMAARAIASRCGANCWRDSSRACCANCSRRRISSVPDRTTARPRCLGRCRFRHPCVRGAHP